MNTLQKKRIGTVLKYTWPFYVLGAALSIFVINLAFKITHRIPDYKTLTVFITGEVKDSKKLKLDLLEKFKDKELKSVSLISAKASEASYDARLTVPGYISADVFIIPTSKLEDLALNKFALELKDELINSYYQGYSVYQKENLNYGVKINKEIVKDYMTLPDEDCYLLLSGKSINTGIYSSKQIAEYDNALNVVKDWGM